MAALVYAIVGAEDGATCSQPKEPTTMDATLDWFALEGRISPSFFLSAPPAAIGEVNAVGDDDTPDDPDVPDPDPTQPSYPTPEPEEDPGPFPGSPPPPVFPEPPPWRSDWTCMN